MIWTPCGAAAAGATSTASARSLPLFVSRYRSPSTVRVHGGRYLPARCVYHAATPETRRAPPAMPSATQSVMPGSVPHRACAADANADANPRAHEHERSEPT